MRARVASDESLKVSYYEIDSWSYELTLFSVGDVYQTKSQDVYCWAGLKFMGVEESIPDGMFSVRPVRIAEQCASSIAQHLL